ncbi:MAG: hypothetical protein KY475_16700 [Planctomycetes bacterium]|nr:hypothetical protein [Planctomycetota bacterium]
MRFNHILLLLLAFPSSAIAGGVTLSVQGDDYLTRELQAIQQFLEGHTGLKYKHDVEIRRPTVEAFRHEQKVKSHAQSRDRIVDWKILSTLELIDCSIDSAEEEYRRLVDSSLAGYYDYKAKEIVLPRGSPDETVTLAHELHHALIDQNFGLGKILDQLGEDEDEDAFMAALCVIEGTAIIAEEMYQIWIDADSRDPIPGKDQLTMLLARYQSDCERVYASGVRGDVIDAVSKDVRFPYSWGVCHAIQNALANLTRWKQWYPSQFRGLPESTSVVLGKSHWNRESLPAENVALDGWTLLESGTLGELYVRLWHGLPLTPSEMDREAIPLGLVADRFVLVENEQTNYIGGGALLYFASAGHASLFVSQVAGTDYLRTWCVHQDGAIVVIVLDDTPAELRQQLEVAAARVGSKSVNGESIGVAADMLLFALDGNADSAARITRVARDNPVKAGTELINVCFRLPTQFNDLLENPTGVREARIRQFDVMERVHGGLAATSRDTVNAAALRVLKDPSASPVQRANAAYWLALGFDELTQSNQRRVVAVMEELGQRP